MNKTIKINCTGTDFLDINHLKEFQENIKSITPENKQKLKDSILKHGIIAPFFIWKKNRRKNILDGHQRLTVLKDMKESGHLIPPVPVIYVQAKTEEEAKEKLLQITSQYGDFELKQLDLFIENLELKRSEIRLMKSEIILENITSDDNQDGIKYKEKYELIIDCENEENLESIFNEFKERGFNCKISTL